MADNLYAALAAAQAEFPSLTKDAKNDFKGYKYVTLDRLLETVSPALHKHGLAVTQHCLVDPELPVHVLRTTLTHAPTKEQVSSDVPLLVSADGKNAMQDLGAALTYARRYGLSGLLAVAPDEDDDAASLDRRAAPRKSAPPKSPPKAAASSVEDFIRECQTPGDLNKLLKYWESKKPVNDATLSSWVDTMRKVDAFVLERKWDDDDLLLTIKNIMGPLSSLQQAADTF